MNNLFFKENSIEFKIVINNNACRVYVRTSKVKMDKYIVIGSRSKTSDKRVQH